MLTIKTITEHPKEVVERLKVRNFDATEVVKHIRELDKKRKALTGTANDKQAQINALSKEIGQLYKNGEKDKAEKIKEQTGNLKEEIKTLNDELKSTETNLNDQVVLLPNLPHPSVPAGKGEDDNETVSQKGEIPDLGSKALPHWELASKFDIIDFELGNKLTGAGFPVYKKHGAKLQRALINFFLDEAQKEGYQEVMPPLMINESSGFGTGQLPDKEGQMYHIPSDNYYLIPTAEVPVTNIYRDVIVNEDDLPIKNTAYTPCFRREAGSWGSHVRGLNRLHQFDKVEIVQIVHPGQSYDTLEKMLAYASGLIDKLELPYRVLRLCGGDIGFTSALTYDLEVFSAGQGRWLEVSSVSNFESFQANRLKLRYRDKQDKKPKLAHTLNGSALALPRIVAAILENNQTIDGIKIPEVLIKYTGFDMIDNNSL